MESKALQIRPRTISFADSVAPTLHSNKNGRENTFFTERRHSEQSAVGLTGSYETLQIAQAEVREKCANSILVRLEFLNSTRGCILLARKNSNSNVTTVRACVGLLKKPSNFAPDTQSRSAPCAFHAKDDHNAPRTQPALTCPPG